MANPTPQPQQTARLLLAAAALSQRLLDARVPHAFHGGVLPALLANAVLADEIVCIVEPGYGSGVFGSTGYTSGGVVYGGGGTGGGTGGGGGGGGHPFRRTRDALAGDDDWTATHSPWTNRLHVSYRRLIPPVDIEILPAGETGPRHLDTTTVMQVQGVPFLAISEFIRAKLNAWVIRGADRDAADISFVLVRYWNRVDINRITEADMAAFVARHPAAAPAWAAVRRKYGM